MSYNSLKLTDAIEGNKRGLKRLEAEKERVLQEVRVGNIKMTALADEISARGKYP